MNKKSKKIIAYISMAIFVFALTLNLRLTLDDSFTMGSEIALGSGATSGSCNCVEPQFLFGTCNQRVESIATHCTITKINRTYFDASGAVCGTAIITGGTVTASTGVSSGTYEDTTSSEEFDATRVNCPTDGNCNNCTEYKPCT